MRRGNRMAIHRPAPNPSNMSRELDWVLDEWRNSSPEEKLKLVLAKIKHEAKSDRD